MLARGSHQDIGICFDLIGAPAALVERREQSVTVISANSSFAEVAGLPVREVVGSALIECLPRYLEKQVHSAFDAGLSHDDTMETELVIERGGEIRWWRLTIVPITPRAADRSRALAVLHDISEVKQRAIEANADQQRFQALVATVADGIITVDQNQRLKMMNDAARDMFRVAGDNVVGWHLSRLIPERYRYPHGRYFDLFRKSPVQVRPMQTRSPIVALRADGTEFYAELTIAKIAVGQTIEFAATIRDVTQLMKRMEELQLAATHDALTGIANRRHGTLVLTNEISRSLRFGHALTLALFDLDDFKHVNDTYGHACGDDALKSVVAAVSKTLREADVFCRWGGEEFIAILPETSIHDAMFWAERVRDALASNVTTCEGEQAINITASFGLAAYDHSDATPDDILQRADDAMYRAKRNGRNQICIAE